MTDDDRTNALSLMDDLNDPDRNGKNDLMARLGRLISKADSYDPIPHDNEIIECCYGIYRSVWEEANELRNRGILLEFGNKIKCPVVAVHGDHDPHPAEGVRVPLAGVLADLTFHLLENCGHYPWWESDASERFFEILRDEIR